MSDLTTTTTEDLKEKRQKLQAKRSAQLVEYRSIGAELNSRAALEKAKKHVEGLSDSDKAKLVQTLQASGIQSGEAVGKIGGK